MRFYKSGTYYGGSSCGLNFDTYVLGVGYQLYTNPKDNIYQIKFSLGQEFADLGYMFI